MTITTTIELNEKQSRAFSKRITGSDSAETLAANIVIANAQMWADSDYSALSSELVSKLKDAPQDVLDKVTEQLLKVAPEPVVAEPAPEPISVDTTTTATTKKKAKV